MKKLTSKEYRKLERENDLALIEFWKATEKVEECRDELNNTSQALALREAEYILIETRTRMTEARYKFLQAKVESGR